MAALCLPDEIIETILLKLPIKSLMRFKSVSKSWNSMISDLRFIGRHYELSMNSADSDNLFLHISEDDDWFSLVRLEGKEFKTEARVMQPVSGRYGTSLFVCIADGLVLLHSNNSCNPKSFMLWNPLTRQETILRFPYSNKGADDVCSNMYGVCYDPINEDVKVVIASKDFYSVYSWKNSSWAGKIEFPYEIDAEEIDGGLSVDGAIYWNCHRKIVCFDSKDDSFKILLNPEDLPDDQCYFHLKARKGRLYLCCYGEDETVGIWIKEKSGCSWRLLVSIDNLDNIRNRPCVVAPLRENGMIMGVGSTRYYLGNYCAERERTRYCIYNCCDKSYQEFEVNTTSLWTGLHPFLGSMFFPVMKRKSRHKRKLSDASSV